MKDQPIIIFRSQDASAYAQAFAILQNAKIPVQSIDKNEGGSKTPRTMHMLAVTLDNERIARELIANVPSEIIMTFSTPVTIRSKGDRVIAWLQILPILIILAYALIKALTN